jgi:hypothetical protein
LEIDRKSQGGYWVLRAYLGENTFLSDEQGREVDVLTFAKKITSWHYLTAGGSLTAEQIQEIKTVTEAFKAEHARYYLCQFKQRFAAFDTIGEMYVAFVEAKDYPPDQRELAEQEASRLEQDHYNHKRYNVVVTARLSLSREDAKNGMFLDE